MTDDLDISGLPEIQQEQIRRNRAKAGAQPAGGGAGRTAADIETQRQDAFVALSREHADELRAIKKHQAIELIDFKAEQADAAADLRAAQKDNVAAFHRLWAQYKATGQIAEKR